MATTLPMMYEFTIYRRTTFHREFRWLPAGDPQDFTGWTGVLRIGLWHQPALMEAELTLTDGGLIIAELDAAATATLPIETLVYELDLTDAGGFVTRFMHGQIRVVSDVEPPEVVTP